MPTCEELERHPTKWGLILLFGAYVLGVGLNCLLHLVGGEPIRYSSVLIGASMMGMLASFLITIVAFNFAPWPDSVIDQAKEGLRRISVPCLFSLAVNFGIFWPGLANHPQFRWWAVPAVWLLYICGIGGFGMFMDWLFIHRPSRKGEQG